MTERRPNLIQYEYYRHIDFTAATRSFKSVFASSPQPNRQITVMLGRQHEIVHEASFHPRVEIKGVDLGPSFKLPSLNEVFRQVVQVAEDGQVSEPVPEPAGWVLLLGNLLMFSFGAHTDDVPVDLIEDTIFVLQILVHVLSASIDQHIRPISQRILHCNPNPDLNYIMEVNARYHLTDLLMKSSIDRPLHALPHFRAIERANTAKMEAEGRRDDQYEHNLFFYSGYSAALTFTGHFSANTKEMLERVLMVAMRIPIANGIDVQGVIVRARINMVLVLEQMDIESEVQKQYTDWVVQWLRKNRRMMPDLEQFVRRSDQPSHPIFKALGPSWFETLDLESTSREDFRAAKILLDCQKAEWQRHKPECKDRAAARSYQKELRSTHSPDAQRTADWIKWRDSPHHANRMGLAQALGLHRDPSRGRTHIVFRIVQHVPEAPRNDIRRRFKITHASVFKLNDETYHDIDVVMGLDDGESRSFVAELLEASAQTWGTHGIPVMDLTYGNGLQGWLGCGGVPLSALRGTPHDPDWRLSINEGGGDAVLPYMEAVKTRAQDAEHVF
ncbi:hypothetical protein EIP91_004426 [Steccherinum ochraceum]|uniref:Uncharacterized protein n=1 Tax=Steccherinum ochraceum TaxID=92696 RepID=A0A4R0RBY5_9APHY|nr:hypothetical protein EIP91_004426 [Steccherinum ochraceum]